MAGGWQDGLPVVSSDRVIVNTRSGQLSISTATTNDAGKYLCISSNVVGRVTADRVVDIHSTTSFLSLCRHSVLSHELLINFN